jgi:hypothetical protein
MFCLVEIEGGAREVTDSFLVVGCIMRSMQFKI